MRIFSFTFIVASLALVGVLVLPGTSVAQDLFVKRDQGSSSGSSEGGSKKLYLTPDPSDLGKRNFTSSNKKRTLYNNAGRDHTRRGAPSTVVNRDNELDRIQQANIDGAQARAARNAQTIEQMKKKWDAERAAADEAATKRREAELAAKEQQTADASASGEGNAKDLTNAKYLDGNGKKTATPTRTFNIFR